MPVVVGSSPITHPIYKIKRVGINCLIVCPNGLYKWEIALYNRALYAKVAELVDALDLGSSVARRESSSLSFRTIIHSYEFTR